MPLNKRSQLPRGVVRDLLGITRALYRAELAAGGNPVRLQALVDVGRMLRTALELSRTEPDTIGHRAAWGWAGKATAALGDFVATGDGPALALAAVLRASTEKLRTGS
jgi:hypothetical protein